MAEKLSREAYLTLVQKSGLVEKPRLRAFVSELRQRSTRPKQAEELADEFVAADLLTRWQARTLLKGRYKGFHLGKYKFLDLLGAGGMGSVYLAEHVLMRRKVAIKVLPPKRIGRKAYLQRFYREARAVAQLDHPNIVRAYDVDQDGDVHFLVMEYVDGTSLHKLIRLGGPLPPRRAADYIRQASEGLHHAFEAGLVHRDIKPGNLLVDRRETVKLADLGLARFFSEDDDEPLTTFQKESVLGTVDYLAPEQALDSHAVDIRADIYSLGCTLYFLLTGQPPFAEGTMAQRLMYHQTREPVPLRALRPEVPPSLAAIVEKMMAKEAGARYQTPEALNAELDRWLASAPIAPLQDAPGGARTGETDDVPQARASPKGTARSGQRPREPDGGAAPPRNAPVAVEPTASADALDRFLAKLESDSTDSAGGSSADSTAPRQHETPAATRGEVPSGPASDVLHQPLGPPLAVEQSAESSGTQREETIEQNASSTVDRAESAAPDDLVFRADDDAPRADSALRAPSTEAPRDPRNKYYVAAAVLILSMTVLVVVLPLMLADKKPAKGTSNPSESRRGSSRSGARTLTRRKPRPAPKRSSVTVKPFGGDFSSIAAALDAAEAGQVIRVAGGEIYRARIALDGETFPEDVQLEVEGGARATLQASEEGGPLIQLRGVKGLRLRGFDLDAQGHEVAVRLEGALAGTRLSDLSVRGFTRCAVEVHDGRGEIGRRLALARIRFQDAQQGDAVGVLFGGEETGGAAHVVIDACHFDASMAQGVRFETSAAGVEVSGCMLGVAKEGIVFEATPRPWRAIALVNNTFYGMQRGVVFREMPAAGSRDLSMCNNLFYNLSGPAGEVEQGYDDPRMVRSVIATNPSGLSHNWDNRPAEAAKQAVGVLPLFGIGGRRGPFDAEVISTDTSDPDFLRPRRKSRLATAGAAGELPAYVGALAPEQ